MTSKYTDAERAAMIAASRETVARLHEERRLRGTEDQRPNLGRSDDPLANLPPREDRIAKWRREADEQTAREEAAAAELRAIEHAAYREQQERAAQAAAAEMAAASRDDSETTLAQLRGLSTILEVLERLDERLARVEKELKVSNAKAGEITDMPPFLRPRLVS